MKNNLKKLREKHGYTQKQVGEFIGMSQSAYSRIERGEGDLVSDVISSLKKLYHVSADEIIGEGGR